MPAYSGQPLVARRGPRSEHGQDSAKARSSLQPVVGRRLSAPRGCGNLRGQGPRGHINGYNRGRREIYNKRPIVAYNIYSTARSQCCRFGFGISGFFDPWIQNPNPRKEKIKIRIRDLGWTSKIFWVKQYFGSLMEIWMRDFFYLDPGHRMGKFRSGIRHKHPGSAKLHVP